MAGNGVEGVGEVNLEDEVTGVGDRGEVSELVEGERRGVPDADTELEGIEFVADVLDVGVDESFGYQSAERIRDGDRANTVCFFRDGYEDC